MTFRFHYSRLKKKNDHESVKNRQGEKTKFSLKNWLCSSNPINEKHFGRYFSSIKDQISPQRGFFFLGAVSIKMKSLLLNVDWNNWSHVTENSIHSTMKTKPFFRSNRSTVGWLVSISCWEEFVEADNGATNW